MSSKNDLETRLAVDIHTDHPINTTSNPPTPTIRSTICSLSLWRICCYGFLIAVCSQQIAVVMPTLSKDYFNESDSDDSNCHSAQSKAAMFSSISRSVGGLLGFLFEGYIGRLSDAFGRKKIMYFTWICFALQFYAYAITKNIWFYYIFGAIGSLNGTFGGMPTVLNAALADVTPIEHRTFVFSILFGVAGLVILFTVAGTELIVNKFGDFGAVYASCIAMFITLLYLAFVVKETLDKSLRKPMNESKKLNPFAPLLKIKDNKIILWFCIIALFTSVPDGGLGEIISSYLIDVLDYCDDDNKATMFNGIGLITLAISMLISQLFVMPMLIKCFKFSDIKLFFVGLLVLSGLLSLGILTYFIPNMILGIAMWALYGATYILVPITNGALSKRLLETEQGLGLGCLHSVKGITYIFAPMTFGLLYNYFEDKHWLKTMPFIVALVFILAAYFVLLFPLKRVVNEFDKSLENREGNDEKINA